MLKMGIITSFLSQTRDRFHAYNRPLSLEEKFALTGQIDGIDGVEIVYPYEVSDPQETAALVAHHGLTVAAVNVNVKAEPEFRDGGLTSNRPQVRAKAVDFIRRAKDFAAAVGADKVTCCPLADGYEFCFQYDYASSWHHLVETLGQAAAHRPDIPLFVEYKPSETRGRCFLDTAAKTLCLLNDIGNPAMGVTLDFGHSVYGGENPAEALSLLQQSPYPYYIHINDNDGRWDWDYFCGTHHFLHYAEFLYYLKRDGYDDYLTSDTSPTRWDIKGTFEANARLTRRLWDRLDAIDPGAIAALMAQGDYLATWRFVEENLLGLGD